MKKILIILLFVFLLTGCVKQRTENAVENLNENSNFEYGLLIEITSDIKTQFNISPGFGVYTLYDLSIQIDIQQEHILSYIDEYETTTYDVTSYPDYSNGGEYITMIWTTDPEIHIYDLSVGDSYMEEELNEYMIYLGFARTNDSADIFMYNRERLNMSIFVESNIITKMYVRVDITNRWDIQY